ncbi:MAG: hypothetical protein KKC51_01425, partial [Verrucomicrobia bacterium]|nr:hypothetical protein [Verrucomicrobiota bacterium]
DSGAVVCYCFNATGLHGTFTGEPIGWYAAGATVTVTVTAVADPYYHFAGWSGETQGDTNALTMTLTMTMDQARFLLAFFAENLAPLGTPEVWLASWGWTSNFGYWETNDTDGDFFFAWQEQIADTDPTSSNSFFHLMNVGHTNSFAVTFSCTNTRVYNLEFNTNLFAAWASVSGQTNVPGAAGGSMTLTDTVDAVRRAYRVGVSENTGNPH